MNKYTYYLSSIWKLLTGMKPCTGVVQAFLRPAKPGLQTVELRKSGLRFKTRGVMDIWSLKETFLDRFYEKFGVSIGEGWTIIDIGGGIGDFTIFVAAQHPKNVVYAFEPTPESFALLQENLELNRIQNAQIFPQAIWSEDGQVMIDTTVGEPGQFTSHAAQDLPASTPAPGPQSTAAAGKLVAPSLSLAQALEATGLGHCNLLKIDCEGAEYEILFNTPDAILGRIERIIMEYHNVGEYTHVDLERFLRSKGFAVKTYPNYVHDYLGYLYASR